MRFIAKNALFLNNLGTITQEGNMEAREMTPSFSSPFSALTVCNSHFCISKYSKFIFMWSILFCRTPQFRQKLPIWTVYYSFLETKHPEVTENSYYVLFPEGSQKNVSVYGLQFHTSFCFLKGMRYEVKASGVQLSFSIL